MGYSTDLVPYAIAGGIYGTARMAGSYMKGRGGKRIRRSRSRRVVRRRRVVLHPLGKRRSTSAGFNEGYSMLNKRAVNSARRKMRHKRIRRKEISLALMARVSMNFNAINEIEAGRGRLALCSSKFTYDPPDPVTGVRSTHTLPCHLFRLDNTPLSISTVSTASTLVYTTDNTSTSATPAQYRFVNGIYCRANGDGEAGSAAYNWNTTDAVTSNLWRDTSEDPTVKRKWYQKSVEAEFVMYGQTNQDTLFRIDIVRMDGRYARYMDGQDAVPADVLPEWNAFWHSVIAPYTQNPAHKPRRVGNHMKIVKSFKFKMPEQSADFERASCVKTKVKLPLNRIINRYWRKGASGNVTTDDGKFDPENIGPMDINSFGETADSFDSLEADSGFINPNQRYYMLVRATNTDMQEYATTNTSNPTVPSAENVNLGEDPTYDIKLRSTYLVDL